MTKRRWQWVFPDDPGFRSYCEFLWDELVARQSELGVDLPEPVFYPKMEGPDRARELSETIARVKPSLIHFHHEFGFVGSKVPGKYQFPTWVKQTRAQLPDALIAATAHTVIQPSFRYPLTGRRWQIPLRALANVLLLPRLRRLWGAETWGRLDGVTVHSGLQVGPVRAAGCRTVREVPHYVPLREKQRKETSLEFPAGKKKVVVFGYLTPEKGQDVAIQAWPYVDEDCVLILAGGLRRAEDQGYYDLCQRLIQEKNLADRVKITGFIPFDEIDAVFDAADLVVLPFRETSGSGSLADAICREVPILASDHPLNLEISQRVAGAFEYFRRGDARDCAEKINLLMKDGERLTQLRRAAGQYAEKYSPGQTVGAFLEFYRALEG